MTTYVSLLRGINVGGKKIIKMAALRDMYAERYTQVRSYLQSGNVVFVSDAGDVREMGASISHRIEQVFDLKIPVLVLTLEDLEVVIANNPWRMNKSKDPSRLSITFLATQPVAFDEQKIVAKKTEQEEVFIKDKAVYLYCPMGFRNSKLNNAFFEKQMNTTATTRNWNTTKNLLALAKEDRNENKTNT